MSGPRVLDLFCGEGGAGAGYAQAGFEVFGVDNAPARLKLYPFESTCADAIEYVTNHGHEFDLIHASPTCTGYSRGTVAIPDRLDKYDRLIAVTRAAIEETGKPYVIENVEGALSELVNPTMLCWSMFYAPGSVTDTDGTPLRMERHRLFESNLTILPPASCNHPSDVQVAGAYGGARRDKWEAKHVRKGGYVPPSLDVLRALVGASWMSERGAFLSIPPVYTHHIGVQAMAQLGLTSSERVA